MAQCRPTDEPLMNLYSEPESSFTLPGFYYYSSDIFQQELSSIFYRSWQYACHVSELRNPGDYFVRDLGDQSVVILRDSDSQLRGFHNVCQHRAHRLLENQGHLKRLITCPYHAWSYDLEGHLIRARGSEGHSTFDVSRICLSAVKVDVLCGFVFFNLDSQAESIHSQAEGLEEEIRSFLPEPERLKKASVSEYPLKANWKNSVENFSECYHCPGQHRTLSRQMLDINSYQITLHSGYHSHRSQSKNSALDSKGSPRADEFGGWLFWPNLSLEVFPGGYINLLHHIPVSPEETLQVIEWYCEDQEPSPEEQEAIDFMAKVREEDISLCESVQKGLHSQGYSQGLFMTGDQGGVNENAVHDFQQKVLKALS